MKPREIDLVERYQWKKVEAPRTWRPKTQGEELVGFYGGKTLRNGAYGQYEVVLVHVPRRGTIMVSGTRIVQLVDASAIEMGWPIRIVWLGLMDVGHEGEKHQMKNFEVFVAEGDPASPEDLPTVPTPTIRIAGDS